MARSARTPRVGKMMNSENLLIWFLILSFLYSDNVVNNQENFKQRKLSIYFEDGAHTAHVLNHRSPNYKTT